MTTHAPHLNVNEDHFATWVHQMRTTPLPQTTGHLAAPIDGEGPVGYCCLGLGSLLVPDCPVTPVALEYDDEEQQFSFYFGSENATDLAPIEFIQWLLPEFASEDHSEFDLRPDLPRDLMTQGRPMPDGETVGKTVLFDVSASKMNDDGLTFAQIADVFAYFGIGGVDESR